MSLTLVTGATGWLGTQLVQNLVKGFDNIPAMQNPAANRRIRCLTLQADDLSRLKRIAPDIEFHGGDLCEADAVINFCRDAAGGTLFHCAGLIHPRRRVSELYEVNVTGTLNLLQAAEAAGVKRVIAMSSNSPLGTNPGPEHRFDESSPYHPYMNYGRSKMQMELLLKEFQQRGKIEIVIVRSPWFYGPFQPERQSLFFRMIRDGKVPLVGNGENRRSMAYVENISQGMILCEKKEAANGQVFWIADAQPYTMNEIIVTIENLLENEFSIPVAHKRLKLPFLSGEIATLADRMIQGLGLYNQKVHVLSEMNKTIACSIDKAKTILNYDPKISLKEGMRRSLKWVLDTYGKI
ncbi:MAG: NAD(P)-dependent oxidoreductase [Candidatus Aminicenantes bacterium]|nr:NAD(P)-dependent oxidoreductase [Candidatus Aminicenantes bacterium]